MSVWVRRETLVVVVVYLKHFFEELIIGKVIKFICSFLYLVGASLALFVIGETTTDTKCIYFLACQSSDDGSDPAKIGQ